MLVRPRVAWFAGLVLATTLMGSPARAASAAHRLVDAQAQAVVMRDARSGVVSAVRGLAVALPGASADPAEAARAWLTEHASEFGLEPGRDRLEVADVRSFHGDTRVRVRRSTTGFRSRARTPWPCSTPTGDCGPSPPDFSPASVRSPPRASRSSRRGSPGWTPRTRPHCPRPNSSSRARPQVIVRCGGSPRRSMTAGRSSRASMRSPARCSKRTPVSRTRSATSGPPTRAAPSSSATCPLLPGLGWSLSARDQRPGATARLARSLPRRPATSG